MAAAIPTRPSLPATSTDPSPAGTSASAEASAAALATSPYLNRPLRTLAQALAEIGRR